MRYAIALLLSFMLLADLALSKETALDREFARLILERSELQVKLAQDPSPEAAKRFYARLKEIDRKMSDMGIDMPPPPEPPLSQVDRTEPPILRRRSSVQDEARYQLIVGISPSYNNNYFQAVAGAPQQEVWLTNVSTSVQFTLAQNRRQQLTAGADIQRNLVRGIKDADWSVFGANVGYAIGDHQVVLHGFYSPKKLSFVTDGEDEGLARTTGLGADYNWRLTRNARIRLFYRLNDVRYPGFEGRNVRAHFGAWDAQYRFHSLFIPGIGFEWTKAKAESENYVYREITPVFTLGARLGRIASLNVRYRRKLRDYTIDDPKASNAGRRDVRHDGYVYASIGLGKQVDLILFGNYLQSVSSRSGRSFTALQSGATLRYRLPH